MECAKSGHRERAAVKLGKTLYAKDRKAWRAWLAKNHGREPEVWLVYPRRQSGRARVSYNAAVEEALSYGWIDSTVKSLDDQRFAQRFSPRRKTSGLSQMNRERVRRLIAAGKMTRAGLVALAHVFDPKHDLEAGPLVLAPDILGPLKANRAAWRNFRKFPATYRRIRVAFIESRRRHGAEAFRKSLAHFIRRTAENKRFGFVRS